MKNSLIRSFIGLVLVAVSVPASADETVPREPDAAAPVTTTAEPAKSESAPAEAPKTAEAATDGFTGEAAVLKKLMEDLFLASRKVNGAEKAKARGQVEGALDWDQVARACLGPGHWAKHQGTNREHFQALLKEVVVKTAYSRMDKFWDETSYKFDKIDVKGPLAHIVASFNVKGDVFAIDYFLSKRGGKWLIHDVSFEDLRYSENINEQISSFLKEKSFAQLLTSLKKRRDELLNPATKKKS